MHLDILPGVQGFTVKVTAWGLEFSVLGFQLEALSV